MRRRDFLKGLAGALGVAALPVVAGATLVEVNPLAQAKAWDGGLTVGRQLIKEIRRIACEHEERPRYCAVSEGAYHAMLHEMERCERPIISKPNVRRCWTGSDRPTNFYVDGIAVTSFGSYPAKFEELCFSWDDGTNRKFAMATEYADLA